jgi:protoporphyrinogen oxidase
MVTRIGILGGGLTGLTIANSLSHPFELLEKEHECGGLCRTLQQDGFSFDYGGAHIIFSRNAGPVDFMLGALGENRVRKRRNNKVLFKGRLVKYPFENGLSDLPKEDCFECLYHYLKNDYAKPSNLREWLYYTFGKGIAEKYLIPYNEKIWNYDISRMSMHWVEGRIPKPPLEDVVKSAVGIETEGYTHQLYFYYPNHGGIQALIRALEDRVSSRIHKDFAVSKVYKRDNKWVISAAGDEREFDTLISTIPVLDLAGLIDGVPRKVVQALSDLKYNSLISVLLGVDVPRLNDITAIYLPDKDFYPNRVAFPMNFSDNNVPEGKSSIIAEITANEGDGIWELDDSRLAQHVVDGLDQRKIINRNTVCFSKVIRSKYAYVVYDLGYSDNTKTVRDYFTKLGIILCGRFSEFEYLNMDACIERGIRLAHRLNSGEPGQL